MSAQRRGLEPWLVALTLLSVLCSLSGLAGGERAQGDRDEAVEVRADRMVSDTQANQLIFSGNVEARRGDLVVKADRLEVTQERQSQRVSHMVASGHVSISKGEQAATADRATYLEREQKIVLSGNPYAREGTTEVWGEEMVFFLAEGKMVVTGGAQRVRMQLLTGSTGTTLPTAKAKGN